MKYIYSHVSRPRLLAVKLRAALAAEDITISKSSSYNLLARIVGHSSWAELLSSIDPDGASTDDKECSSSERASRLQFQISKLVEAGIPQDAATRVVGHVSATARPKELDDNDFLSKDRRVYEEQQTPGWFQPGKVGQEALERVKSMKGPFLRNNPDGPPIVMSKEEVIDLIMEPERGFRLPPDQTGEERVVWKSPTIKDMKPYSTPGWSREETERYHNWLLARGAAREWNVYSVRAVKMGENGNWFAAPGRLLGKIVINKGLEMEGTVLRFLGDAEICSYEQAFDLDMVVTSSGMCAVNEVTRVPVYILKPKDEAGL